MTSKLQAALRQKYPSPQAALRALGLDPSIINGPRLACDRDFHDFRPLVRAFRAKAVADAARASLANRWPTAAHIKVW